MEEKFQIYGSASSIDIDMMVFVDSLGTIDENKKTIEALKEKIQPLYDKKVDIHLAVLKDGKIIDVSHGTYDECNNSLYYTYKNHRQLYPNVIESVYERIGTDFMHIKMIRVARFILSFFSREPELREFIKPALRGDFLLRLSALSKIDFSKYKSFPKKNELPEDIYKVVAFQFAQVLGLLRGQEIYTKEDAIEFLPIFQDHILRNELKEMDFVWLTKMLKLFITLGLKESSKMKTLIEPQGN